MPNKPFAEWNSGNRDTPSWGEMTPVIKGQSSISRFKVSFGVDIVDLAHAHFKHLCDYTTFKSFRQEWRSYKRNKHDRSRAHIRPPIFLNVELS